MLSTVDELGSPGLVKRLALVQGPRLPPLTYRKTSCLDIRLQTGVVRLTKPRVDRGHLTPLSTVLTAALRPDLLVDAMPMPMIQSRVGGVPCPCP